MKDAAAKGKSRKKPGTGGLPPGTGGSQGASGSAGAAGSGGPGSAREEGAAQGASLRLHAFYAGKMETALRCPVRSLRDFAYWYTPGVAAPCREIERDPEKVYEYTGKWNTIAVVSDGSRVLGLGDIGPKAGLPVMEGKALLFKYLGGVDCVPITLDTREPEEIIRTVLLLQPAFGGINLEDLAQPKCFRILQTLRERAEIPVWHDDQQGTATVTLAGLINALRVVQKPLPEVSIAFVGSGAANIACARLIFARGADPGRCRVVDSAGILGTHRQDVFRRRYELLEKWKLCESTNREGRRGGIAEAMEGADVAVALSRPGPGTIRPEWVRLMHRGAVVFACANPVPEIWPWEAREAGAEVVATGRSDFPNQVNNSLCFPGIFRGVLDVRARTISDGMCFAAAEALARAAGEKLGPERILPSMEEWQVVPEIAAAVGLQAQAEGLARLRGGHGELYAKAEGLIRRSRELTRLMMERGLIPPAPAGLEEGDA
jgi:malate dehydrogenase (oxaloacetate-decarboxylating)